MIHCHDLKIVPHQSWGNELKIDFLAHFGMLQEHRDMLRKNRLFLLDEMNPEPVIQRLRQSNILTHLNMESIQAVCPTNYHKNEKVIDILP